MSNDTTFLSAGNMNGSKYIIGVPKKEFLVVVIASSVFLSVVIWLGIDFYFYLRRRKQSMKQEIAYQNDRNILCAPDAGIVYVAENACGPGISISGRRKSSVSQLIQLLQNKPKTDENGMNCTGSPSKIFAPSIKPIEEENESSERELAVADIRNVTELKLVKYENLSKYQTTQYNKNSIHPLPPIHSVQGLQNEKDLDEFDVDCSKSSSKSLLMNTLDKEAQRNATKRKSSVERTRKRKEKRMRKKIAHSQTK